MKQVFRFQMLWSENPLTIAEVFTEHDAQTFRSNPEWYEIKEPEPLEEAASRKRKTKGEQDATQEG